MRSRGKTLVAALLVGVAAAVIGTINMPRLSKACDGFREQMEQLALNDSGFAGAIISVPASTMDEAFFERYGKMTDGQCTERAQRLSAALAAITHTPWAANMGRAGEQAKQAIAECRGKRESGELKTHADSAECSNPKITAAFLAIHYPYMDIVMQFEAQRLAIAGQVDKSMLADTEDLLDFARLALELAEAEAEHVRRVK